MGSGTPLRKLVAVRPVKRVQVICTEHVAGAGGGE